MRPIRKLALLVMTLSVALGAGQVVQGNARQAARDGGDAGAAIARQQPGALPRLPAIEARLPAQRVSLAAHVRAEAPAAR